jgi:hypothetical protein
MAMSERPALGHPGYASPSSRGDLGGVAAATDRDTPHLLVAALRENEALQVKLVRVSRAIHGLVSDLAATRRECRRKQLEIESLRAENAALAVAAPPRGDQGPLQVRRLTARCGAEAPKHSTPSRLAPAHATDGPASADETGHLATGRLLGRAQL